MKLSKYLFLGAFLLSLVLFISACGAFGGGTAAEPPEPGIWQGNVFINEQLGLHFTIPDSWEEASQLDIAIMETNAQAMGGEGLDDSVIRDLTAINHDTGASVQLVYTRHGQRVPADSEIFEEMSEVLESLGFSIVSRSSSPVRIGNYDWIYIEYEARVMGTTVQGRQYYSISNGYIKMITITSPQYSELLDVIFGFFSGEYGQAPVQHTAELMGTWFWDEDFGYMLNFNDDGTGSRGWEFFIEDFTWRTNPGGGLLIYTEIMTESWTYSVNGGVLVLDSLNFPGESYNYIKVEIDLDEALVGEWRWADDDIFVMTFYSDGTGTRNWMNVDVLEAFMWFTSNGMYLDIYSDTIDEVWMYMVSGNNLTIESLDIPGLVYNYVRN